MSRSPSRDRSQSRTGRTLAASGGGGGGGGTTVTERGTSTHGHISTASPSITFPTGIQVGDLLIATWGSDFHKNSGLTGWTILYDDYANYFNGSVAYIVATSTETAAGNVTLGLSGAAAGEWACIAIQAGTFDTVTPIRVAQHINKGAGAATLPQALTAMNTTASSQIYHFASRSAASQTLTCSVGTVVWATSSSANGYNNSSALYSAAISSSTSQTPTWTGSPTVTDVDGGVYVTFEVVAPYAGSGFAAEVAPSLQAWWKFDETSGTTAADSSGNARNATYDATRVLSQSTIRAGGVRAAKGNGSVAMATIANAAWMNQSAFTVTAWIKANTFPVNRGWVGRYDTAVGSWLLWTPNAWGWLITAASGDKTISYAATFNGDQRFIAMTYDGSTMSAYMNGSRYSTLSFALGTSAVATGIGFDAYSSAGASVADGTLQDVTFHSAALTDTQIWAIYQSGNH